MVPVQRVISELFEQYRGKPALVIGGGPSVASDLYKLRSFYPSLVLSANEHGCKQTRFAVDYIVHCDKYHCLRHEPMVPYLRRFGKPLISRWASADVRLEDWHLSANSGVTAVAIATALGCSPIVVTGLDFWASGRHYFWDNMADIPPERRRLLSRPPMIHKPDRRLNVLAQFAEDAHIRPMSGLLTTQWPVYDPAEQFGVPPRIRYAAERRQIADYKAVRSFHWSARDTVDIGTVLRLTKLEAGPLLRDGKIVTAVSPA